MFKHSKKTKTLRRVFAWVLALAMCFSDISMLGIVQASETNKIDVWDFGAEQLDTAKYNNKLTVDEINSWYPGVEAGTKGVNIASFTSSDGELTFHDGGKATSHRLRTENVSLTRYDGDVNPETGIGRRLVDADGNIYHGFIYSNSSGKEGLEAAKRVSIGVKCEPGDIITLVSGSNGGAGVINFEAPSGKVVQKDFVAGADSSHGQVSVFYATESGMHTFYYTSEKLVVARIYREHTNSIAVAGTVTAPAELTGYSLVFKNQATGVETVAAVADGSYSANLNTSYTYDVSLKDANGYIINSAQTVTLEKTDTSKSFDVEVNSVNMHTITGNITGLSEEALGALNLSMKSDEIYVPEITVTGTTYSMKVETGVTYTVVAEGINDYALTSNATVTYTADGTADITFEAKPTYAVTIAPEGAELTDLANATFTFTNLNEEGYVYAFTGIEGITLRDGTYSVKVTNSGRFVQELTANVKVNGAATTHTIPFNGDVTSWDFAAADFVNAPSGEGSYNGLTYTNAKSHNGTYMLAKAGTVSVPVKGPCQIVVTACYEYSFYFEKDTELSVGQKTGSTGQLDTFTYDYSGAAGMVDITVLGQSYLCKIEIVDSIPYKDTITVGATGCDYTTINDALDAVKAMPRPNDERVIIAIQPGNYEEMLVVDVPNVTLKNASATPSIELKDKGVNIEANAVRITHYYGCGYNYYSMGTDCKWDADILAVNKANGYTNYVNPGDGTTDGSYWNATVVILADGFEADGIIFENSFNQYISKKASEDVLVKNDECKEGTKPRAEMKTVGDTTVQDKAYVERAAALAIGNNYKEISFDNCKFIGRQDTLYGGKGTTAAFYDCAIYGGTDYIFGGMTAVFAKCDLVFNTSDASNDQGYITAPQTAAGSHGYLMYNCTVKSTTPGVDTASEKTSKPGYFGRPWGADTTEAVFYKTVVEASATDWYEVSPSLIHAEGWKNTLSGSSALCTEWGTYEMAKDVDNSTKRASWTGVLADEKLASGEAISVATFLGDWDAFAGKDMTITMPTEKVDNAPKKEEEETGESTLYVLDTTKDLTAFAQGTKADGDTEVAGTNDFFTLMYSAKTKVDSSNKTFEDGYAATQRVNLGGAADPGNKNVIKFTTDNPSTVKVWWVEGGDDNRQIAIYDANGTAVDTTAVTAAKNATVISTFELDEAGTYYLGSTPNNNYFFKVEVEVAAPAVAMETKSYVLDTTIDLTAFAQGAKADGDTEVAGTEDYFTLMYSAKTKVDSSNKTFDDEYTATQRVNFGGAAAPGTKNVIKFVTEGTATVKVWWVEGGDDNRQIAIYDANGTAVDTTAVTVAKNATVISTFELDEAGTYYLGSTPNNNYFFKVEVTVEVPAEPKDYILDTTADLTAFAQGAKADGDTEVVGTEDFFTLIYSAKTKVDSSSKTFEDGYAATQRVNFGGAAAPGTKNVIKFTTDNSSTVKVWWVEGGDDNRQIAIYDASGNAVETTDVTLAKNATAISTFELDEAGTYYLGSTPNNNYFFKVQVTVAASGAAEKPRAEWSTVEAPSFVSAVQEEGNVLVTVKALVGDDGADELVVTMYDETGAEIGSKKSVAEKDEHTLTFTPEASGTYTFKAVISRENETDKTSAADGTCAYVLPLGDTSITSVTSLGGGKASVKWTAVKEAEKYLVTVDGTEISKEVTGTETTLEGLTVGKEYTFKVVAIRGDEKSDEASFVWTITDEAQREWSFAAFGSSTNTTDNVATGSVYDDNLVVKSVNRAGKIVPATVDGLAFYYTTIDPETENFTLSADITVDSWTYTNGQEGFGIMAADAVGTHGDKSDFWNNSYMNVLTKIEYYYNTETNTVSDTGSKYGMYLGAGAIERIGATPENIATGDPTKHGFTSTTRTLDVTAPNQNREAGNYNIVGNCTNASKGPNIAELTTFHLELQRNNTGYILTYKDKDGNVVMSETFYHGDDGDELTKIDKNNIYVGFFASRNATISVKNVELTTIHPDDDAPKQERPITLVTPNYTVESSKISNTADYDLVFYGNADGKVTIEGANGVVATDAAVTALTKTNFPVKLDSGKNTFYITFTPDADYVPGEYSKLSSYDTVKFNFSVTYDAFANEIVYISPNGQSYAAGTKDAPVDIYTAVAKAAPGQKLYLMEGTYNLETTVRVERGINGTADAMIYLVADPEATTRPVLDFGLLCAGMVVGGDYWYLQGFDVTRSAAGQKGLQISGDYNVVDDVDAYRNGNTGIQISRLLGTDLYPDWPHDNLILNCTSYLNADPGYEDADGFAAKLTIGDNNVFDGCIAAYNADDGWDLFAKIETGAIGVVTIKNSIAFKNGYDIDENGKEIDAGNGNGFKMGGSSITGYHVLENSIAFANKAKGIDSNSCPDIQVKNSTSFNNGSFNVAFYTNSAANTDYAADGIVSYKDANGNTEGESIKPKGTQDKSKYEKESNYFFPDGNTKGVKAADDWFVNLDTDAAIHGGITRNADGTINMNGYLELTDKAPANVGADLSNGTASGVVDDRSALEIINDATADLTALEANDIDNAKKAIEDVVALPDTVWTAAVSDDELVEALAKLQGQINRVYGKTVAIVNEHSSIDGLVEYNAILSLPEGQSGTLVVSESDHFTRLPAEYDNYQLWKRTAFDLSLYDEAGNYMQLDVPMIVEMHIPAHIEITRDVVVLHKLADGTIETLESHRDGEYITFVTTSLSDFEIANKVDKGLEEYPSDSTPSTQPGTAGVAGTAGGTVNVPIKPTSPKTYDDSLWSGDELKPVKPVEKEDNTVVADELTPVQDAVTAPVEGMAGEVAVSVAENPSSAWLILVGLMGVFGVVIAVSAHKYLKKADEE